MGPTIRLVTADRPTVLSSRTTKSTKDSRYMVHGSSARRADVPTGAGAGAGNGLPQISRLDTTSFTNLFEEFQGKKPDGGVIPTDTPARGKSRGGPALPPQAGRSQSNVITMASEPHSKGDARISPVARGDSTASSASSRPFDSDRSAPPSRRSSQSSLMVDTQQSISSPQLKSSPGASRNAKTRFTSLSQPNILSSLDSSSSPQDLPPRAVRNPTDLFEKPLPIPPFDVAAVSKINESPSRQPTPQRYSLLGRPLFRGVKSASTVDVSVSSRPEKSPLQSPKSNTRGARLGKAMTQGIQRRLSKSLSVLAKDNTRGMKPLPAAHVSCKEPRAQRQITEIPTVSMETADSIPPDAAEAIVFHILKHLNNLRDLQSAAMLNRGFYATFKRHEAELVGHILRSTCPAAWEALHTVPKLATSISLCLYHYYYRTLSSLRSAILSQSKEKLRPEMFEIFDATAPDRKQKLDSAVWRTMTFCHLFGPQNGKEQDLSLQVDWLQGGTKTRGSSPDSIFGLGNGDGLSDQELVDMNQIWEGLKFLLTGFADRSEEARQADVFKSCSIDSVRTEEWYLQEWVYYILSLGPFIINLVASCDFRRAEALGLADWTPPPTSEDSRSMFLTAAIDTVLQDRAVSEATLRASKISLPRRASQRTRMDGNGSDSSASGEEPAELPGQSDKQSGESRQTNQLEWQSRSTHKKPADPIRRKPVENRPSVRTSTCFNPSSPDAVAQDGQLSPPPILNNTTLTPSSPISNPTMFQSLAMMPTASTRLSATLFPISYPASSVSNNYALPYASRIYSRPVGSFSSPIVASGSSRVQEPEVIDPVDKALALLVQDMGFSEIDAKRALARCDTGFGMDVQKAIEMLASEMEEANNKIQEGEMTTIPSENSQNPGYCHGCGRGQKHGSDGSHHPEHSRDGRKRDRTSVGPGLDLDNLEEEELEMFDRLAPLLNSSSKSRGHSSQVSSSSPSPSRQTSMVARSMSKSKAYSILGIDGKSQSENLKSSPSKRVSRLMSMGLSSGSLRRNSAGPILGGSLMKRNVSTRGAAVTTSK